MPRRLIEKPVLFSEPKPVQTVERIITTSTPNNEFQTATFNTEDINIPTFLRKRLR
jgi:hypothetical protein